MKNRTIMTAACTPAIRVGNPDYNVKEILKLLEQCSDCGLAVFPELCVTGYTCADLFGQKALLEAAEKSLVQLAEKSVSFPGLTFAVGAPLVYHNEVFNAAVFIGEGKILAVVPKINIPAYNEFYEGRWFASGRRIRNALVRIGNEEVPFGADILLEDPRSGAVIGTEICEDLWVPDKPGTYACMAGANILVNLSASDELIGKNDYRRMIVQSHSGECYCAYIYAGSCVNESSTDLVFPAHAMIAENGKVLNESIFPESSRVTKALIDLERCERGRIHQNTYENRYGEYRRIAAGISAYGGKEELKAAEFCGLLEKAEVPVARNPFVPDHDVSRDEHCRDILAIQTHGLVTRVKATGICNLVIGISGGLDSTLALIVCYEAKKLLPKIRIIAYTMPNEGNTTSRTLTNALALMDQMADESRTVAIGKAVKDHLVSLGHSEEYQGEGDTAYENAQARTRTMILMNAANMENALVIGTGDLSELALGWCTYNGDHMSMYGVNGSVPKTLVQYICRWYGAHCGNEKLKEVLDSVLDTPISPELTPSKDGQIQQKTEDKIGKYDLNDFFLYYVLRYGFAPDKILGLAARAYQELPLEQIRTAAKRFYTRFVYQQFKRSCLPDGPKVGSVSLSPRGDWRMPSDADPSLWLKILEEDAA